MVDVIPRRYYVPPEHQFAKLPPEQVFGAPRPGFGSIHVHQGRDSSRERNRIWVATWVDEFPTVDAEGAAVGIATFEGTREEVLTWTRRQDAASYLLASETASGWIPLPPNDEDIAP